RVSYLDRPKAIISRGRDSLSPLAQKYSRIPAGHPEGYFEAFANIYGTYCTALNKTLAGETLTENDRDFPDVSEGVRGVRFIEKCVESSRKGAVWVDF
ncbi:MAG: gfo/Idh/MocA family oxidoreductase, partial [Candidatus Aminicenantales bacterium]